MSALEFLPEAALEAEEATRYYEERVPGLGMRFRLELKSVCTAIARKPLLWRERVPAVFVASILPGSHSSWLISFAVNES